MSTVTLDELVAAAKHERAPEGAEARAWAGFAAAVQAGALPIVPSEPMLATSSAGIAKGVVALVLSAGVTIATANALDDREAVTRPSDDHGTAIEIAAPQPATVPAAPPAQPEAIAAAPVAAPARASRRPRPRADAAIVATDSPPADDDLLADARLLGGAWLAIREHRSDDALAQLAEHARRFPDSALAPERRAAEAVAHCERGDAGADRRARALLDDGLAPRIADRVRAACLRSHDEPGPAPAARAP